MNDDLLAIKANGLVTSRYQAWRPVDGVPVRTTVGEPKFWPADQRARLVFVKALAPWSIFARGFDLDENRRRYLEQLDRWPHRVWAALAVVARAHPGQPLCLLCFEDVHAGQHCHRRWFAEWAEQFGLDVPEVGPAAAGPGARPAQLF